MATEQYNPLDKLNLGKSVAEALLKGPIVPLGEIESFKGAGIYAIYYHGSATPYEQMTSWNASDGEWPIYVGKAIPSGGRKGLPTVYGNVGKQLYSRLKQHAETIRAASNLEISDFTYRCLIVDDIWIPLGETLLITKFKPVWNLVLDGFGNHDPGKGRYNGLRPLWDVLHPGREWAMKCKERSETPLELEDKVKQFLAENAPNASKLKEV